MANDNPIIRLTGVTLQRGERHILDNVNLTVNRGDFLAVTGPNGGGKTTLLRLILKLLKPDSGAVEYFNSAGQSVSALHIGYLPQKNMIDSHFPVTVRQVIAMGLMGKTADATKGDHDKLIADMTETVGLHDHADSPIGTLSGGQLQRALLGRALVSNPELLILDEPLSYLDKTFEHRIYDILENAARHATIILVSHEMSVIAAMANRHLIVDGTAHECTGHHHFVPSDCN